ncbi:unnamed protein product [Heligmosomoides polygyrus]|uniref:ZZ-type domain-containing protein n=1 Tax=Heligmosomoides polygyrus TaxID=6339 RepID=A0A183GD59_HELPZ|nr:unnamed protein product [Heligmosomoides polygyrus]
MECMQTIDEEVERMLIQEEGEGDRVQALQSQVTTLMEQVQKLTQQAAQVRSSLITMTKGLQALQNLPERVHEKLWRDSDTRQTAKNRDEVTKKLHELADKDCEAVSGEFEKVEQFINQFSQWQGYNWDQLIAEQNEFYEQAQHDDQCIRQLAKLLAREQQQHADVEEMDFRNTMRKVREGCSITQTELPQFDPAHAEQVLGRRKLSHGQSKDASTEVAEKPRIEVGLPHEDPLHLFHPCDCGIFHTKAQTALPSLRSDLARSKPVNNMFELANVASIVLDPFWGDRRKEEELMAKESKHLTVLGLAHAIAAHRSCCFTFNRALRAAEGKRIIHPSLFPSFPGYNIDSYYAQAMERLDQIPRDYDDSPANPTIVALPLAFLRAEKDLEEDCRVKIMVYTTLDALAALLNERPISGAIVFIWPDTMPATSHLNNAMQALERHLQCGGTLDMYPPPYEERRSELWHEIKQVCAEVVKVLTGPARGFEARVADSYGTINDSVPLGHPATCLGISPRRGDAKYHPWQIAVFLNQVRKFAMGTLTLPIFFATKKATEANDDEPRSETKKQSVGPSKKPSKIIKPNVSYLRDAKKERQRHAHLMKQKRQQPKQK